MKEALFFVAGKGAGLVAERKESLVLCEEEEAFVQALVAGCSLCEAYRRAYPKGRLKESTVQRRAERLMEQERVRARYRVLLDEAQGLKEDRLIADDREVLAYLTAVMRGVRKDSAGAAEGKRTDESVEGMELAVPVKVAEANKAAELLGKRYGLFSERVQVHQEGMIQIMDDIPEDAGDVEVE